MAFTINEFLIGQQKFANESDRKQSILLGQLALVSASICLIYLVVDPINGLYSFIQWYILGIVISFVVVFLNRAGRYLVSSSILLLVSTAILFVIAWVGNPNRGVYFFFLAAAVTSLAFFYNRKVSLAILFIVLNVSAALTAYLIESPFQESVPATKAAIQIRYSMNFILGTLTAVVVVLFMIRRNNESELSLIEINKKLALMTKDLERSKTRFERAVAGTKAGIYEWNIINGETYVSKRWKRMLGYSEDETRAFGLDFFMGIIHPDDIERTTKGMEKVLAAGGTYRNELRLKMNNNKYRWFIDSGLVELKDNKPFLAVGSIIDINDRKKAEAEIVDKNSELEKANDELDRFVYSASHDLRAPLSTLLGLIEVLKMSDEPEEYQRYFDMMTSRINDMEGFISEVTDYSRNTRLAVNIKSVNLFETVDKIKESFSTLAEASNTELIIEIDKKLFIKTDETRLKVVLNNLVANAIKYNNSEEKRYVKVRALISGNFYQIEVEDNGTGIDKIYQPNIFDMFFRATEDSSGSGLGLYIVKETMEKLGGKISFVSEIDKGTTFTVLIPQGS